MSLEAGRIVGRVIGDTTDFDKSMADAQRTFQVTAQKLDASAQHLAASLQRTYAERIASANAAANKEIEAARRSLQERIRSTQSSSEIVALREQFNRRAEVARAGAAREIDVARQQYLAASHGLRPIINAGEQLTSTAALGVTQLSKLRTATVAVANAAAGAHPIFAQTSAVLGGMVGAGGTVALAVAAIAALGFAYNRATKDAREFKEEQKRLNDQLERAGRERAGLVAGAENVSRETAATRNAEILLRLETLRTEPQFRITRDAKTGLEISREQIDTSAEILKLSEEYKSNANVILGVDSKRADEGKKAADELARLQDAQNRLAETGAELGREWQELLRENIELMDELAFTADLNARLFIKMNQANKFRGATPQGGLVGPSVTRGGVVGRGAGLIGTSIERLTAMREERAGGGQSIGEMLKSQFSTKRIISNVVSGGVSALVGAAANFATGLFTHAKRAKEALRLHMEAVNDWDRSIRSAFASLRGETEKARQFEALDELTARIRELGKTFGADFGAIPVFDTMEQLTDWLQKQQKAITALGKLPGVSTAELSKRLQELIDYAKELGISLGDTSDAAKSVSESMTNVPNGFKIALARFNATAGKTSQVPWIPDLSSGFGASTQSSSSAVRTQNVRIDKVEVYGVEDVPDLLAKIETEVARKQARGGTGLQLGYL